VNRGTVRLLFDLGPRRYVVARELRRAANGSVSVKNARLERLNEPTGTGTAEEDTEILAADSQVSAAVEDLLGLPFEHFCTCVVLPQGAFAEFLHARPADRQKILTQLLGLGIYEAMAKRAGERAADQRQRAEICAEQLDAYADATPEAAAQAAARVAALDALADRLGQRLPDLAEAISRAGHAAQTVTRLTEERTRLAALTMPAGLPKLDQRRRQRQDELAAAQAQVAEAEAADTAARQRRADAPPRAPLEQARRDHAALAEALAAEPAARARHAAATAALATAGQNAVAARSALDAARTTAAAADDEARTAAQEVARLLDERDRLAGLAVPERLAELAAQLSAADRAATRAQAELDAAEVADAEARDARSAAGSVGAGAPQPSGPRCRPGDPARPPGAAGHRRPAAGGRRRATQPGTPAPQPRPRRPGRRRSSRPGRRAAGPAGRWRAVPGVRADGRDTTAGATGNRAGAGQNRRCGRRTARRARSRGPGGCGARGAGSRDRP
jgi:exonuclease SbcC